MTEARPDIVVISKANAGIPRYHDGHIHYSGTPELMASYAERLARRSSNHNLGFRQIGFRSEQCLLALAYQIPTVGCTGIGVLLIPHSRETLRFEPERQTAATGEEVKHEWGSVIVRP